MNITSVVYSAHDLVVGAWNLLGGWQWGLYPNYSMQSFLRAAAFWHDEHRFWVFTHVASVVSAAAAILLPFTSAPRSIVMSMSVCLSVCSHNSKTTQPNFTIFCVLPMSVARSSFGSVAIRYVLPVLWMTSCFYTVAPMMRRVHRNSWNCCVDFNQILHRDHINQ